MPVLGRQEAISSWLQNRPANQLTMTAKNMYFAEVN
jgi:hypothetical protein